MLGSSAVTRGRCLRWLWFVKWALAKAGRDLHPSAWSQKSHQNNNYNLLLPWPCPELGEVAQGMSCWPLPAPMQQVPRAVWSAAVAARLLSHTLAPGAHPLSCTSAGAAASILLFLMTLVRAGFGQKNVFWTKCSSFQSSPSSDQVSSAK